MKKTKYSDLFAALDRLIDTSAARMLADWRAANPGKCVTIVEADVVFDGALIASFASHDAAFRAVFPP